jgi:patatin-like phospholipase/acyl hydrolase
MGDGKPFRVLSLDGGGSKGVYTLGVLKEVEALANAPLHEVFDLIFGTSTGSIIAALIALGYSIADVEKHYFEVIPRVMERRFSWTRSTALRKEADALFGERTFSDFKMPIGIVTTNHGLERPMIFKLPHEQAHGSKATFKPGFGCTIADAVMASCAAYPFFSMVQVKTENQGDPVLMDGGYVANNPTLFAIADARNALKKESQDLAVLSVGVGSYNEPKKSIFHRALFSLWPFRHIAKMFNISSITIDQLRVILFPDVACVRVSEAYPQAQYATDLLESDPAKLRTLFTLGRASFEKHETSIRSTLRF